MAELVDAPDLGSGGLSLWGFESPSSYQVVIISGRPHHPPPVHLFAITPDIELCDTYTLSFICEPSGDRGNSYLYSLKITWSYECQHY